MQRQRFPDDPLARTFAYGCMAVIISTVITWIVGCAVAVNYMIQHWG